MSLSDLASIGSLVSGIAVLVSLLYLAQQTRQNSRHTRALIQQGRAGQTQGGFIEWIATDASTADVYLRGIGGDTSLDSTQFVRFLFLMSSAFFAWEDNFFQHRDGLVEDGRHAAMTMTIRTILSSPGAMSAWQMGRPNYAVEFQAFMDGILRDGPGADVSARDPFELWKSLLPSKQAS